MKRTFILTLILVFVLSISACSFSQDKVLNSLGEFSSKEVYTHGDFQDYTDYGKYSYKAVDFTDNTYFRNFTENDREQLANYIDDFEGWVTLFKENDPTDELAVNYDFDSSIISEEDYLYIYTDPDYPQFGNYRVYFFDTASSTLYYFHKNI